ncbi:MAG: response regulator [bacterium]
MPNTREVKILLVEDDPGHARLIEKNLRRSKISNDIQLFGDGQEVLDYLLGNDDASGLDLPAPVLVLLDLRLPRIDGYRVLERMKADERAKKIPVVVLTTTDDPREVERCYDLGCNVFITKPVDYDRFAEAVRNLGLFFSVVTIPEEE